MSRRDGWKIRLQDMQDASQRAVEYCEPLKSVDDLTFDRKTFDACIRNLQILGDAAKKVPAQIQKSHPQIPWKKIKGMRDVVVHEYFGTSAKIVWQTVKKHLPKLIEELQILNRKYDTPIHAWKACPAGEIYVRSSHVDTYMRGTGLVHEHPRREHCREKADSAKDILTTQELNDMASFYFADLKGAPSSNNLGFKIKGQSYDSIIRGWTKYWNDIFQPSEKLDPNVVKALIASESSFNLLSGKNKRGSAKGLMQLMPATLEYLKGHEGELDNNVFDFSSDDVWDPNFNISAGVRWLFRKRETASSRLKRTATWTESVAEYKDYLRRKLKDKKAKQKGMETFEAFLRVLEGDKK